MSPGSSSITGPNRGSMFPEPRTAWVWENACNAWNPFSEIPSPQPHDPLANSPSEHPLYDLHGSASRDRGGDKDDSFIMELIYSMGGGGALGVKGS